MIAINNIYGGTNTYDNVRKAWYSLRSEARRNISKECEYDFHGKGESEKLLQALEVSGIPSCQLVYGVMEYGYPKTAIYHRFNGNMVFAKEHLEYRSR